MVIHLNPILIIEYKMY